jgi:DNA invertase Pin-like site-specific DNA recombinase
MMNDCRAGKIDIILTKSISRFARNTVDLLVTVRELKERGIEVRFEKENICTLATDGEIMLTIMASFAQFESESLSENVKWGMHKRFEKGDPCGCGTEVYGYRWDGKNFVIEPEEARVIQNMYDRLLRGDSVYAITKWLNSEGRETVRGKKFSMTTVRRILGNELYIGKLTLMKTYIENCISKKVKRNNGERRKYEFQDHHPAIIERNVFDKAQEILMHRAKMGYLLKKDITCFTHKIQCAVCGKYYVRFQKDGYVHWVCRTRRRGKECNSKYLPDDKLKENCCKVMGLKEFDEKMFSERIDKIVVPEQYRLVFHMKDGSVIDTTWMPVSRKDWWTPERRAERSMKYKGRRLGA